ncbi:MAG: hypothetical protein MI923_01960 [Phycisphaerales bacterium]|nr:hypothetical protein [Phycisphaerales bacterium]
MGPWIGAIQTGPSRRTAATMIAATRMPYLIQRRRDVVFAFDILRDCRQEWSRMQFFRNARRG